MRADLHTHSAVSDGTDSPRELVCSAKAAGLDVVALTDHDTYDGLSEAALAAQDIGIDLIGGIEISCRYLGVSVHLLGYGPGPHLELDAELAAARRSRTMRLPRILQKLSEHGMDLSEEEVYRYANNTPSLGRPHVADAMVARGFVANRGEAFAMWLAEGRPAYADRYAIDLATAIRLVREAGGVPVIAHPWSRQSRDVLVPDAIESFAGQGLFGIEVDHPDHDLSTRDELRQIADSIGIFATGSSDYHGLGKINNDLGCETTSAEVLEELRAQLAESR